MATRQEIESLLEMVFKEGSLIFVSLSSPRKSVDKSKVEIRPIVVKSQACYQLTEHCQGQAFHRNLDKIECLAWLKQHLFHFKQTYFFTSEQDYQVLVGKKDNLTLIKHPPSKASRNLAHNRQKNYLLKEGVPIPFLIHLGVMNAHGRVYAAKMDKFRQINRFVEMIDDILPYLNPSQIVRIVDFGCGKAYLTFALYHYLKITKSYQVQMIGLDLKQEVICQCQELAHQMGYENDMQFIHEDINLFTSPHAVDLVVSLHACDTATDAALEKAIRWNAKVILCVPCCQHELISQIEQNSLLPLLKHGILKERFAALATDAARAQLLDVLGYQTQIMEFIDLEHTPKNLLIRAIKNSSRRENLVIAWQNYLKFKEHLAIHPSLEQRFRRELP